jgi:hypothetical protein
MKRCTDGHTIPQRQRDRHAKSGNGFLGRPQLALDLGNSTDAHAVTKAPRNGRERYAGANPRLAKSCFVHFTIRKIQELLEESPGRR